MCFSVPLVSRKSLEMSTILLLCHFITSRFVSLTVATCVHCRFSFSASSMKRSFDEASTTTAIRSCDSLIASSVPSRPSYFFGTLSRFISRPSASSPMATDTPPAPKSLHLLINLLASGFLNSLWSFLSSGALPFCTSAPAVSIEDVVCDLEEPVAPPQPSLPVFPPRSRTTSPFTGLSLITFSAGAAATTAPTSILLATYPSWYISST